MRKCGARDRYTASTNNQELNARCRAQNVIFAKDNEKWKATSVKQSIALPDSALTRPWPLSGLRVDFFTVSVPPPLTSLRDVP